MEKAPLISIVIPARVQNSQLLVDILHCLERQTFQDFEVIIVCDRFFSHLEWEILQYLLSIKTKTADYTNNRRFHISVFKMLSISFAQSISMSMDIFPLSHQ